MIQHCTHLSCADHHYLMPHRLVVLKALSRSSSIASPGKMLELHVLGPRPAMLNPKLWKWCPMIEVIHVHVQVSEPLA